MTEKENNIAIFGGSFNPPASHHVDIARELSKHFDEVRIVPCGPRPDKPTTNEVPSVYRAAMVDMAFQDVPQTTVDLFDLESDVFTRTIDLEAKFSALGKVWHIVGADLVTGGGSGNSAIQKTWSQGTMLWERSSFAIVTRPGTRLDKSDLPPHSKVFELQLSGSSAEIRNALFRMEDVSSKIPDHVYKYILRHGLYRRSALAGKISTSFQSPRIELIVDKRNAEAVRLAKEFGPENSPNPDLYVVVGGDGTMLRAIRHHWRKRIPFYGVNAGHTGFLLNPPRKDSSLSQRELALHHVPLLWVETEKSDGTRVESLAFNDAWVERATGQSAWISVSVNGKTRIEPLIGDGVLVATAAGSAAYARAMGAAPIPFNTPVLLLVGSNVFRPHDWKFAVLPIDSVVEFRSLDPKKRPLNGFSDGEPLKDVLSMRIRLSRSAAVELAFDPEFDPAAKLAHLQFPEL